MKENKLNSKQTLVIFLICLCMFFPNYFAFQVSPLSSQIIEELSLTNSQFTSIMTAPMLIAVFTSLIIGTLADKYGIKKIVSIGMVIAGIGAVWRIFSNSYSSLYLSMVLGGCSAAFLNANVPKLIRMWFAPDQIRKMMGIYMAASSLGTTVAQMTTGFLPSKTFAYVVSAIGCVASGTMWILLLPKEPDNIATQTPPPILSSLKIVSKNKTVILTSLALMFTMCGYMLVNTFLVIALGQERGINPALAGMYASLSTTGGLAGSLITPIIDAKLKKTKLLLGIYALLAAVGFAFGWRAPEGIIMMVILFAAGFSRTSISTITMSFPVQDPEIGVTYAGTAGGFCATFQLFGAVIIPTYLITPFFHEYSTLFMIAGLAVIFTGAVIMLMPKVNQQQEKVAVAK